MAYITEMPQLQKPSSESNSVPANTVDMIREKSRNIANDLTGIAMHVDDMLNNDLKDSEKRCLVNGYNYLVTAKMWLNKFGYKDI